MKKYFALLFSLVLFLSSSNSVAANWNKSSSNPISPQLQNTHLYGPSIINFNGKTNLYYTSNNGSGWRINVAQIEDVSTPEIWSNTHNNIIPIGSSNNWEKEVSDPFVMKVNNQLIMWYTSTDTSHWAEGIDRFRTRRAVSADGINWVKDSDWVMFGSIGKWDAGGTSRGRSVLYHNNKYHMWYSGTNTDSLASNPFWSIGYATSNDGIVWEKMNNGEPVITKTKSWEGKNFSYPHVFYENSKFKMYYATSDSDLPKNVIYAESTDGINWEKEETDNPILPLGNFGNFDSIHIANPFLVKHSDHYKLFYSGFNGNKWQIGYATKEIEKPLVPLLKQTSNPWQDDTYNKANLWAPHNSSMYRWGCAVTSAAMVLQYHGYNKISNSVNLDPGTLNTWLNSQVDGYVGNGLVNWHAISRLTKQARNVNGITEFEALEFERTGVNNALLNLDLENKNPAILLQPGHFIVATGKTANSYLINDPYYERTTLDNGYGNTYQALYRYIPSNTDLSTILIPHSKDLDLEVKNASNSSVSETYIQPGISAADNPIIKSGDDIKILTVKKPSTGSYTLQYKSQKPKIYTFKVFLYDINGELIEKSVDVFAHVGVNTYQITFNKENNALNSIQKVVTFNSVLTELDAAYKNKLVHIGYYQGLRSLILEAQRDYIRKSYLAAQIRLQAAIQLTTYSSEILINQEYAKLLTADLLQLKSTVNNYRTKSIHEYFTFG